MLKSKVIHEDADLANQVVVCCYEAFHSLMYSGCGITDLTDGMYRGNRDTPYEQAQANQRAWLLDQVDCRENFHLLDIGCGYGTLLNDAAARGAIGEGITISRPQAEHCRREKLTVILASWDELASCAHLASRFDGIIANGSMEHFVQPEQADRGQADQIYRRFFQTCFLLLKSGGCLVTTAIHFNGKPPDPKDLRRRPAELKKADRTDLYNFALLAQVMGGYYPAGYQLERCASDFFSLVADEDGTDDYRLTSEEWLRRLKAYLHKPGNYLHFMNNFGRYLLSNLHHALLVWNIYQAEAWQWQFRPRMDGTTPTVLRRQVWVTK